MTSTSRFPRRCRACARNHLSGVGTHTLDYLLTCTATSEPPAGLPTRPRRSTRARDPDRSRSTRCAGLRQREEARHAARLQPWTLLVGRVRRGPL